MILYAVPFAFSIAPADRTDIAPASPVRSHTPSFCMLAIVVSDHLDQFSNPFRTTRLVRDRSSRSFSDVIVDADSMIISEGGWVDSSMDLVLGAAAVIGAYQQCCSANRAS